MSVFDSLVVGRGYDSVIGYFENEQEWQDKLDAYNAAHPSGGVRLHKILVVETEASPKVFA